MAGLFLLFVLPLVHGCSDCGGDGGSPPVDAANDADGVSDQPEATIEDAADTTEADLTIPPVEKDYTTHFGVNGGWIPGSPNVEGFDFAGRLREMGEMGPVWLRHLGAADLGWDRINPERDVWQFDIADRVVAGNPHPLVVEVYGSIGVPYVLGPFSDEELRRIYAEEGKAAAVDYILEHTLDLDDPRQRQDARTYVQTVVRRYRDHVRYWEIGNEIIPEPDLYRITAWTSEWIREVHPEATVLHAAMAGTTDALFFEQLELYEDFLAEGGGDTFDVASYHDYGPVEGLEERFRAFRDVLDEYGVEAPIWVTETSTSSATESVVSGPSSEARQARELVMRLVTLSALGAQVVLWHDYLYTYENNDFFGCNLVGEQDGPKPAYHTFRLLLDMIDHYETASAMHRQGARVYHFTFRDGEPVYVAWGDHPGELDFSDQGERAEVTHIVVDRESHTPRVEMVPSDRIPISDSPVFFVLR